MDDILADLEQWRQLGEPILLATVLSTWGSSPRGVGAKMAFTPGGRITGSVSGGCVESAVFEAGQEVLRSSLPQLLHFGVADETAWEVGLACGGQIDVFVQPLDPGLLDAVATALRSRRPVTLATVIRGPEHLLGRQLLFSEGNLLYGQLEASLLEAARQAERACLASEQSQRAELSTLDGVGCELFFDLMLPPPTLVIVGGVHTAIPLASFAKTLGYWTVVIDPRKAFGNVDRFPHVDQLIQLWPEEAFQQIPLTRRTGVVMLTHDPKIDDPALKIVLHGPVFYIGALGSRVTQEKRRQRLLAEGIPAVLLERIHGPVGLDIGAQTPGEIALSIIAELVAAYNQQR